jgi:hypothetical protein
MLEELQHKCSLGSPPANTKNATHTPGHQYTSRTPVHHTSKATLVHDQILPQPARLTSGVTGTKDDPVRPK